MAVPLEPHERHQAIGISRVAGVGDWLLHTNVFIQWRGRSEEIVHPVLFCYGDPGVGKTYLSSLVIDKLWNQADVGNTAVAGVYCDFHAQNEQSTTGLLGVLLKQVVGALEAIPDEVRRAFDISKGVVGGRRLLLPDIVRMLIKSLSCLQQGFICIDALDEFPAKHRPELWECLQQVVHECSNTRLFLTGRPHIRDEVQKYFSETAAILPINPTEHDIGLYLRVRLSRDPELDAMDKELEADILKIIPERMSGIFRLVCLSMDAVLAEVTTNQRRQALDRMRKGFGLQDAHNATLDRIRQQSASKSRLGMEALMWISHCERPLKPEELRHALGVALGAEDFDIDNVPSIRTILDCTLGLVTIDEKAPTVRLLHPTLKAYLEGHPTLFLTAHSMMAEICLTYLNSRLVRALPPSGHTLLATTPFLEYATCYWGAHAIRGVTEPVKILALRLLDGYENHVSAHIFWQEKIRERLDERVISGISGLHCTAFWGIIGVAIAMQGLQRLDVNRENSRGDTPLMWAVKYRNNSMVELFIEQGDIVLDGVIKDGRTLFSFASEFGNERIVKLLLERWKVNPDSSDSKGRTPLSFAASRGHEGVVKLLLECGKVNPDSSDCNGRTPVSYAAERGAHSVVKLLLEREDVNPDSSASNGCTPISYAAWKGRETIVKLLLDHGGVNPDMPDNKCRTPLSYAAEEGKQSVVNLLLERRDVNPDLPASNGCAPISYAAWKGEEGVVKLLLECGKVNPDLPDSKRRTPLSYAAEQGKQSVVKLLLERGDVNPDLPASNGCAPISYAAWKGEEAIVKLLLGHGSVNPDLPDSSGRAPLSYAAEQGKQSVAKLLLERGDVNPDLPAKNGCTPISYAAWKGEEVIVKLLLGHEDVNPDLPDIHGRTPLSYAAEQGAQSIVKLLLEREDVNPDLPASNGCTPISYAAWKGEEAIVKLLLGHENVNPDLPDINGRTPLSYAAGQGKQSAVKLLLERGDVNPALPASNGCTPISYAAWKGEEAVVKLLLGHENVNPDLLDINGRTPLSYAAEQGAQSAMKILLKRGDVNPDLPDKNGQTPLSYAARHGHQFVLDLLSNSEPRL